MTNPLSRTYRKSILAAGTALLATLPVDAIAQESTTKEQSTTNISGQLDDIVVTAQRRESSLQSTAVSISSLNDTELENRSISNIESFGKFSPSMDVSLYQGEAQIYIRGIGYTGLIGGTDSSTALHSNGVFLSRSSAAVPAFLDVERVEVVRGPQGTLYGRNATGGSVNIISKAPSHEWGIDGSLIVGNYDRYQLTLAGGGPLVEDRLSFRAAIQLEDRDGYTTVVRPGGTRDRVEDKHDIAARLSIDFQPTETINLQVIGDYYEADDAASIWLYRGPGVGTNPFFRAHIAANGGTIAAPYSRTIGSDIDAYNRPKIWGISGKATIELGYLTLMSLTAYRETHPKNFNDLDITSSPTLTQYREENHRQFSQEFQLSSPTGESIEWIVGAYYFNESNDIRNEYEFLFIDDMFGLPDTPGCCLLQLNGVAKSKAFAVFGEVNYDVTDRLNLVVGGRYSTEERSGSNAVAFVNFLQPAFDNIATFQPATFNSFSPKFGLNFQANSDVLAYASVSRGFKSGGFNIGSYQNTPFEPEGIWAYELGVKADLIDHRLRVNAAAFYYDYSNLQVQDTEGQNIVIRNAARAEVRGLELEVTALVTPELRIDAGLTLLDAVFKNTCLADPKHPQPAPDPGCTGPSQINIDGFQLPRAPEAKFSIGAQYTVPLASGAKIMLRGDYAWQDRIYFSSFEVLELSEPSYGWGKARITYVEPGNRWRLAAFVDNIGDAAVISNLTYSADLVDSQAIGVMAPPRTFGAQFSFNF